VSGTLISGARGRVNIESTEDTERTEKKKLNTETQRDAQDAEK
jgi:hypothetical protein